MKTFKVNDRISIICEWKKTRTAFKHEATLLLDGQEVDKAKICYQNRTWESYEFQSVLNKIVEKTKELSKEEKELCKEFIRNPNRTKEDLEPFKMVSSIAKLGDLFCNTQEDKNKWKQRMLKAGLEKQGLQFPDDWDELSEDDKEARLNLVIKEAGKVGA